ncbi:hypothetical protein NITHO_3810002 [Nitrolancea hollandica Lb]|uniref:Uncharacterized protein n=1 Tax=Nitrolancea hollandica Lb TaxID=1129897 RepID=I4EJ39_9BACT|nr:hypothetical protein NITHO_3810002 [Nitrolancea hollandica Lb]
MVRALRRQIQIEDLSVRNPGLKADGEHSEGLSSPHLRGLREQAPAGARPSLQDHRPRLGWHGGHEPP